MIWHVKVWRLIIIILLATIVTFWLGFLNASHHHGFIGCRNGQVEVSNIEFGDLPQGAIDNFVRLTSSTNCEKPLVCDTVSGCSEQ